MYQLLFVEAIGGHRGMHYYDFALCRALTEQGTKVRLITCDETPVPEKTSFPVELTFKGIFGQAPIWLRGLRYGMGLARIVHHRSKKKRNVVHTHFFHVPPLDYAFLAWMRSQGDRVVVTAHDVTPFDTSRWRTRLVYRIYDLAHRVIVHTESSYAELVDRAAISPDRVSVIPHGHYLPYVDRIPSLPQARRRLGLPIDDPVILFFGQLKKAKGLDVLLRALNQLGENVAHARLIIAGKVWKDDWAHYAALIRELGLGGQVALHLRHIPDEEVATFFASADVVVLPYRHVYQSGVLLMALSYGRPVIATRIGGMAEVLEDGETGYLVPPGDPEALAESIEHVLVSPQIAQAMALKGQAMVKERYSWTRIARLTRQVYEEALDL